MFWRKSAEEDKRLSLKKGVVAAIIILNYLHYNRPKAWDDGMKTKRQLTKKQWEAVRRLEFFMEAWTEFNLVTPEVMGRTAGKVESLEGVLSELEGCAAPLAKSGGGYFNATSVQRNVPLVSGTSQGPELSNSGMTTFKEVAADRLTFVGRPSFDPTPFLDPLSKKIFNDPMSCRLDPSECKVKQPRLRVHCSRQERLNCLSCWMRAIGLGFISPLKSHLLLALVCFR